MGKTSWQVKKKYADRVYRTFNTKLPIDLLDNFTKKCADLGVSKNEIIRKGMEKYIKDNE